MGSKNSSLHLILLSILLGIVWMAWSGHTEPLLLGFGFGSLVITIWVSKRLSVIDEEGQPTNPKLLTYIPWLVKEIVLANIDVIGRILSTNPKAVEPTWIRVPAKQTTRLGRVIFANSITLTPGTVSVLLDDGSILVNAISTDGAHSLINGGAMGERVCALEQQ
jgi:multicomponent Na+:H+ antiporter subunit E